MDTSGLAKGVADEYIEIKEAEDKQTLEQIMNGDKIKQFSQYIFSLCWEFNIFF